MASMLFKSQLQEYAQKACISAPIYDTVKEGPPHIPNFKASVTVNGVKYESSEFFRNRKDAEHAAAQIALEELHKAANGGYLTTTNPVYETGLCKNLLQEYAQKMSLPVPSYKCSREGEGHAAHFISTVEIAGICYQGGPAKSKKGAEIKAARTALTAIQAQHCFQGNLANPTMTHVDGFSGSWSSQPEVHAGMKRDRTAEQPSTSRRKGKKNKRHKASRKKKEVIQVSTEKEKILGESSSKDTENGQEAASTQNTTVINIDDQQNNLMEAESMDEGVDIKQEQGLGSTDNHEQLLAEVAALVDAKPENQGADMVVDNQENDENCKLEKTEIVGGDIVVDSQGVDEQGKQTKIEDTYKCSVEKGQNEQGTTQLLLMDPLRNHEETDKLTVEKEKETTQQELLDPPMDHEDCN